MMRFGPDLNPREQTTFSFLQTLCTVRAEHPVLGSGDWGQALWSEADILAYPRSNGSEAAIVVVNRNPNSRTLTLSVVGSGIADGTSFRDALSNDAEWSSVSGGHITIDVGADTSAIYLSGLVDGD